MTLSETLVLDFKSAEAKAAADADAAAASTEAEAKAKADAEEVARIAEEAAAKANADALTQGEHSNFGFVPLVLKTLEELQKEQPSPSGIPPPNTYVASITPTLNLSAPNSPYPPSSASATEPETTLPTLKEAIQRIREAEAKASADVAATEAEEKAKADAEEAARISEEAAAKANANTLTQGEHSNSGFVPLVLKTLEELQKEQQLLNVLVYVILNRNISFLGAVRNMAYILQDLLLFVVGWDDAILACDVINDKHTRIESSQ
ncbi:uncharacterized protein LOC127122663 [Lathyrus oleraceus]|uniref:uncharacterized protein LOC127122663 n=1 Tax=Pisum sativum TaxID=3888 RepID=UPI0021D30E77|nr:uncharacterized protein LOC127122663 [Pisum sativum]